MSEQLTDRTVAKRHSIFLSYARNDEAQAGPLARALGEAGLDVWWDSLIEGGAAFAKSIQSALDRCDAVVVLWSRSSVASDWVLDEAAVGRDRHKLVPLSLDGTEPPLGFRQYHFINLAARRKQGANDEVLASVVRAINAVVEGRTVEVLAEHTSTSATGVSRRTMLLAGLGAVAVTTGAAFAWRRGWLSGSPMAPGNSIAVLPFANLSEDAAQAYFSDGLAEEVRATLARNAGLLVMAQASSSKFRERESDAKSIASQLGVAYLLDGSVRRSADSVRVAADLIDGNTGFSRWSQLFERQIDDIFAVQEEIAVTVSKALATQVAPDSFEPAESGGTTNLAAYDAYLHGRADYDLSANEVSERAALAEFDAAIVLDPNYAAAHAARARSLTAIANQYTKPDQLADMYNQAIAAAERAIQIAPGLADAHSTLGYVLFQGRLDAVAAREPYERSRRLGAGEATVMARFAQYCARVGRDADASQAMQRALLLDRLNPLIHRVAGSIAYAARDYTGSIAPMRKALDMNPRLSRAHAGIGDALLMLGQIDKAKAEYEAEPSKDVRLTGLAISEHRLGNAEASRAALDELVTSMGDQVLYQQAQINAQRGGIEASLGLLERARAIGDSGLIYARNDPFLDPLRNEPAFRQLLAGMGFD